MTLRSFIESIKAEACGTQFGWSLTLKTSPKMNKGGRGGVAPNPLFGRVTKIATYVGVEVESNYTNKVNNESKREGNEANFQAQKQRGIHTEGGVRVSDSNPNQRFYQFSLRANTKVTKTYLVDGRTATPEEVEIIKSYTPSHKRSAQNGNEVEVITMTPKEESIISLSNPSFGSWEKEVSEVG